MKKVETKARRKGGAVVPPEVPVPASHKSLIRKRRVAYASGEAKTITMAELRHSIRRHW